jgi:hypothetical protein
VPRVRTSAQAARVAVLVADFVGSAPGHRKPPKKRPPKTGRTALAQAMDEAREMLLSGNFAPMQPPQLVGLYAFCHEQVYGVVPADLLDGKNLLGARSAARKMIANEFAGDSARAAKFVCWVWARERERERWRRSQSGHQGGTGRIDWRSQFVRRALLTDFRLSERRA